MVWSDTAQLVPRPLMGLFYQAWLSWRLYVCVEQLVEWELAREIELLIENLPQCHFVHRDTYMTLAGIESRLPP
jgi:hypothetical protein